MAWDREMAQDERKNGEDCRRCVYLLLGGPGRVKGMADLDFVQAGPPESADRLTLVARRTQPLPQLLTLISKREHP